MGFPSGSDGKESAYNAGDPSLIPGQEDPLEKEMASHSSILASHGQRSLAGCSPWGHKRVGQDLATKQQQQILPHQCYWCSALSPNWCHSLSCASPPCLSSPLGSGPIHETTEKCMTTRRRGDVLGWPQSLLWGFFVFFFLFVRYYRKTQMHFLAILIDVTV